MKFSDPSQVGKPVYKSLLTMESNNAPKLFKSLGAEASKCK